MITRSATGFGPAVVDELARRVVGRRVVVIGDAMVDDDVIGTVDRLSPEAPAPVLRATSVRSGLGGAANAAAGLRALGVDVALLAVVGDDHHGATLRALAVADGIGCDHLLTRADRRTTVKQRLVDRGRQLARIDFEDRDPIDSATVRQLLDGLDRVAADAVVVSDYGKGVVTDELLHGLVERCGPHGIPLLVDPTVCDPARYRGATVVKMNLAELDGVLGRPDHADLRTDGAIASTATAAETLRSDQGWPTLIVTLGEHGMLVCESGRMPTLVPTESVDVSDVSGAGDTAMAMQAACAVAGFDQVSAAGLANVAGRVVVARQGVRTADLAAIRAASRPTTAAAVDRAALIGAVADARARGERVVVTNGCFDLLHGGHLGLLRFARAQGDRLVVLVDSDASVRRLKGVHRPIRGQADRVETLAAVPDVDLICVFDSVELPDLITALHPDVLVKGAEYDAEQIVGADTVRATGGTVRLAPMTPGLSTTRLATPRPPLAP